MEKILITGANGQLGKELSNSINSYFHDAEIIKTDVHELDISKFNAVDSFIKYSKPTLVINCAAFTRVDDCETNVETAYSINAIGPRNLAIASNEIGAKIVHISTDYVFDGNKDTPYNEFDIPFPINVYGKSKLAGEEFVRTFNTKHYIIRTAWLYGDGENFVNTIIKKAKQNNVLRIIDDQIGTPTSTRQLTKIILSIVKTGEYGLYHGTCEGECSWYEFAEEIFKLLNFKVSLQRIKSDEYESQAKRPRYSVLDNFMLRLIGNIEVNEWKNEIKYYIKNNYS